MMRKNHSQPFLRALAAACALLFCGSAAAEDAAVRAVEFTFPSTLNRAEVAETLLFTEDWFRRDPRQRNDALGLASAQLTTVSMDGEKTAGILRALGFTDTWAEGFDGRNMDACAFTAGTRPLSLDGQEATLVAVLPQSRKYGVRGWIQNVTVNLSDYEGPDHGALALAADGILAALDSLEIKGKPVYWISGMSRGGAVSGLLAARLKQRDPEAAVFCYTFEAPANTLNPAAHDGLYGGIFNYTCMDDPVPRFPLWGMQRYGEDVLFDDLPLAEVIAGVAAGNPAAAEDLDKIPADAFQADMAAALDVLVKRIGEFIPAREEYSRMRSAVLPAGTIWYSRQGSLQALMEIIFGRSDGETQVETEKETLAKPAGAFNTREIITTFISNLADNRRQSLLSAGDNPEDRWDTAGWAAPLVGAFAGCEIAREDAYALLEMVDYLIAPDAFGGGAASGDGGEALDTLFRYGAGVMFSHHLDVILSRMKLLQGRTAMN